MDLYSLPKDMLVKMISTIQEETEKKYKFHVDFYEKVKSCVDRCSVPGCDAMGMEQVAINCDYIHMRRM